MNSILPTATQLGCFQKNHLTFSLPFSLLGNFFSLLYWQYSEMIQFHPHTSVFKPLTTKLLNLWALLPFWRPVGVNPCWQEHNAPSAGFRSVWSCGSQRMAPFGHGAVWACLIWGTARAAVRWVNTFPVSPHRKWSWREVRASDPSTRVKLGQQSHYILWPYSHRSTTREPKPEAVPWACSQTHSLLSTRSIPTHPDIPGTPPALPCVPLQRKQSEVQPHNNPLLNLLYSRKSSPQKSTCMKYPFISLYRDIKAWSCSFACPLSSIQILPSNDINSGSDKPKQTSFSTAPLSAQPHVSRCDAHFVLPWNTAVADKARFPSNIPIHAFCQTTFSLILSRSSWLWSSKQLIQCSMIAAAE